MRWSWSLLPLALALVGTAACGDDEEPSGNTEQETKVGDDAAPPPPPPKEDSGPPGQPKVECQVGAALELEPNDTKEKATAFSELALCGVLDTDKDVDYLAFETPPGTKLTVFQAVITGQVDFDITLGDKTFGPADVEEFGSGKYLVKVYTKSGKPGSYRLRVQFDPE
ncbi:MAG: hypothetical protein JST00_25425 [Deltaproteobacteria bacterium]|nr:hypothetical protein [Deltaproteobacteria bacterium]